MKNKINISYKEYEEVAKNLAKKIKSDNTRFTSIYPIPRGGYFVAIVLSQELGLPIIYDKKDIMKNTLIVDDITDSGSTLSEYQSNKKAVGYAKPHSVQFADYVGMVVPENHWIAFPDEHEVGVEDNIRRILEYIGENPNREGLIGTPDRIMRMWSEIFRGYDASQKPKITVFDNGKDGITYDNMVIDEGDFYSMCEHHMMPFFGQYYFAYIPNPKGKILGISKIGRVVDYCAAKMQIQERLVHDVVDMLSDALGTEYPPLGMALIMKGEHLCKTMRGVKKKGIMISSYLTGEFKKNGEVRSEFMNLVKK